MDFKEAVANGWNDKKKNELRKDVVALANGGGGLIVYGIAEDIACSLFTLWRTIKTRIFI